MLKDDQDFFNLLIEETYQGTELLSAHLDCYSPPVNGIAKLLFREQIATHQGFYKKNLKCFRFNGPAGLIDFPQNWGPLSRALFYYENSEKNFYGIYDSTHDPFHFCQLFTYEKILFFSEGDRLYFAGFSAGNVHKFNRYLSLFAPKEIKMAA